MKKYLIDTNVLINFLKSSSPRLLNFFKKEDDLYISYLVIGELLQGVRDKRELKKIKEFLSVFKVCWGSRQIEEQALALVEKYYLTHNLTLIDALIAATALSKDYILLSNNRKHFVFIKDLELVTEKGL